METLLPWFIVPKKRRGRSPAFFLPIRVLRLVGSDSADLSGITPEGDVEASSDVADVARLDLKLLAGVRAEDHEAHGHGLVGSLERIRESDEGVHTHDVVCRDELRDFLHSHGLDLKAHVGSAVGSTVTDAEAVPLASLERASTESADRNGRLHAGSHCLRANGEDLESTLGASHGSSAASRHAGVAGKVVVGGSAISVDSHVFCSEVSVV